MKLFHNIISFIFQPLLMPTLGISIFLFSIGKPVFTSPSTWLAIGSTFVFTALLPAIPILMFMRRGYIKDLYISEREQRTLPYLFALLAYSFWTVFLLRVLQMPLFIVAMAIGATASIVIITLINFRWKISAHLSGVGGLAGGIFSYCYVMGMNPVWLLILTLVAVGLTALSRLELKAHTPSQTLAGFVVGFLMVFVPGVVVGMKF
ncbi:MAG TPA: hypothetical protein PK978_02290 [Paludibacter sp.]|jgi:membrane-associated phospholipid phosphatase|nr:hypothetical protein [Paludibacter sp.]HOS46444.1 hypothetical protein [Paludibacter sp.]HPM09863.1 hypothetical protein [Paludibacter sp.]